MAKHTCIRNEVVTVRCLYNHPRLSAKGARWYRRFVTLPRQHVLWNVQINHAHIRNWLNISFLSPGPCMPNTQKHLDALIQYVWGSCSVIICCLGNVTKQQYHLPWPVVTSWKICDWAGQITGKLLGEQTRLARMAQLKATKKD